MYILSGLVILLVSVCLIRVKFKGSFTKLITNKEHIDIKDAILLDESRI